MKPLVLVFASVATFAISCTANPPILPDPSSTSTGAGGFGGNGSTSSASSASSNSSGLLPSGDNSGTRLKQYSLASADGFSLTTGAIFDSLLGANCTSLGTPMGKRCVVYDGFIGYAFADSGCTIDGALVTKGCQAPKRVARADNSPVGTCTPTTTYRVYDVGQAEPQAYRLSGNTCGPLSAAESAVYDVYAVGPEVDYAIFAPMALEHE